MYPTHEGYNDTLHGYYLEDLRVGMSASHAKTVTETDVVLFAGLTGDNNPIHCNDVFATQTPFKSRIVHGMFCAGLISCVAGTRLPGPGCVSVEQQLRFKAPVRHRRYRHRGLHHPGNRSGASAGHHAHDLHRPGQGGGRRQRHLRGQPPRFLAAGSAPFHSSMMTRKPVVASRWLAFRGMRLAERRSPAPLFQEPPRTTRKPSVGRWFEQRNSLPL